MIIYFISFDYGDHMEHVEYSSFPEFISDIQDYLDNKGFSIENINISDSTEKEEAFIEVVLNNPDLGE